ncbi:hypothetical protein DMUE_2585 [Dictyocoela muelleri]|nr:hypothetical protein DMUE_2585 [Dictyocoela muelleri]
MISKKFIIDFRKFNKSVNKFKKRHVKHVYKKDNFILIRNNKLGKLDEKFLGPFQIVRVSEDLQRVYFSVGKNKLDYRNIKQIKPFWRDADCRGLLANNTTPYSNKALQIKLQGIKSKINCIF